MLALCEWEEDSQTVEVELSRQLAAELSSSRVGSGMDVFDWPSGERILNSGDPIDAPLPAPTSPIGHAVQTRETAAGARARVCTLIAAFPGEEATEHEPAKPAFHVLVRVMRDLAPIHAQLTGIGWAVLLVALFALVVVFFFGAFLSQRFVRPLKELGDAAVALREGVRDRLPRRGSGDEIDQLAEILD